MSTKWNVEYVPSVHARGRKEIGEEERRKGGEKGREIGKKEEGRKDGRKEERE